MDKEFSLKKVFFSLKPKCSLYNKQKEDRNLIFVNKKCYTDTTLRAMYFEQFFQLRNVWPEVCMCLGIPMIAPPWNVSFLSTSEEGKCQWLCSPGIRWISVVSLPFFVFKYSYQTAWENKEHRDLSLYTLSPLIRSYPHSCFCLPSESSIHKTRFPSPYLDSKQYVQAWNGVFWLFYWWGTVKATLNQQEYGFNEIWERETVREGEGARARQTERTLNII